MSDVKAGFVLIVDDDLDVRESVAEALEDDGYRVHGAANGKQALDLLRSGSTPCIIFLDLMMPVMDGYEFRAAQQREPQWSNIPVVVFSAGGDAERAAEKLGAVAYVTKPFKMKEIRGALERFC